MALNIGVDIGGTFTDVVALDTASGELLCAKVNTTPPELFRGFFQAIDKVLALGSASYTGVARIAHGTTVATNAIVEAKGARIGILVTEGFEDTLAIGRQKRSEMYDVFLSAETPVFLAPRRRIFGVRERLYPDGAVDVPLDDHRVARAVDTLVNTHGVDAIAVCYLFSFANPRHEERTRDLILERHPGVPVSLSSSLDPRFREYERLCLTAFDAYLRPVVERYVREISGELKKKGIGGRFHIMNSRGGITTDESVVNSTVSTVLSGPAAGVVGSVFFAKLCGLEDLITLDIGGTSCDIALVEKGKPLLSSEGKIGKYPLRQPMLDIDTIGAGGGSIAWTDGGGALRVGPGSAGANPGPACYGSGGEQPTVTDATLVLGYLDPDYFAGGSVALSRSRAEEAIKKHVAGPLGLDLTTAAQGIHTIVNNNMADEIRLVSVFRGYDPRKFSLVAVGGAGPVHACRLAQQTNIRRVLVPPNPGVLSAFGLLVANLDHQVSRTYRVEAAMADLRDLAAAFQGLEAGCRREMDRDWMPGAEVAERRSVEMRYAGQSYELELPFPPGPVDAGAVSGVVESFHRAHERVYGHRDAGHLVDFVTLRVIFSQAPPQLWTPPEGELGGADPAPAQKGVRQAHFTEYGGYVDTPVYAREALKPGMELTGPAIVEQADTTTVVYPAVRARMDRYGNLLMEVPA
jgi:N-methylhydantoinase A